MASATADKVAPKTLDTEEVIEVDDSWKDIPYAVSGEVPPIYYNAYKNADQLYVNAHDQHGRSHLIWKGYIKEGTYRFDTPRQEEYVRNHIKKQLNGGDPDRWRGDNLDEDDRFYCKDCGFTTRNSKVAVDHRRNRKHAERL